MPPSWLDSPGRPKPAVDARALHDALADERSSARHGAFDQVVGIGSNYPGTAGWMGEATVAMPAHISTGPPKSADSPAVGGKHRVHSRSTA